MIHGLHISRAMIAGCFTITVFMARALDKFLSHELLELLTDPYVVFILLIIAGSVAHINPALGTTYMVLGVLGFIMIPLAIIFELFYYYRRDLLAKEILETLP